jgi:hypothetical protein
VVKRREIRGQEVETVLIYGSFFCSTPLYLLLLQKFGDYIPMKTVIIERPNPTVPCLPTSLPILKKPSGELHFAQIIV